VCGRYANSRGDADLRAEFAAEEIIGEALPPSWNVAPTQQVRAVLERSPRGEPDGAPVRQLRSLRWGLVPSWATDPKIGVRMINARVETITEKPAFKTAAARRRCLLPADGYYEWEKQAGRTKKVPYFLHGAGGAALAFAGLYELWRDHSRADDDPDRWLWSVTVITTQAGDALGHIHDRTPLVVPDELRDDWLDSRLTDPAGVRQLLDAVPEPRLVPVEVATAVNTVTTDGPELVRPVGG
jgi:putative SOS response-associated peptidase YedK